MTLVFMIVPSPIVINVLIFIETDKATIPGSLTPPLVVVMTIIPNLSTSFASLTAELKKFSDECTYASAILRKLPLTSEIISFPLFC